MPVGKAIEELRNSLKFDYGRHVPAGKWVGQEGKM
jgi:hypothetical protein